jgi:uncharacterized protein YqeY
MNLKEQITADLTTAMKTSDKTKLDALRSLRASILEFEKSGSGKDITDDDTTKILLTAAKKRREAIELYEQNNRPELADKEKTELAVILSYLPKQLSKDEIAARVKEVIAEVGAAGKQDIHKVMPVLMKEMKGKADGKLVKETVEELLGAL